MVTRNQCYGPIYQNRKVVTGIGILTLKTRPDACKTIQSDNLATRSH